MKKVILLSGLSNRFTEKGYPIKPLIKIKDQKIIEWAVKSVYENESNYKDYIFVVKNTDVELYDIKNVVQNTFDSCTVEVIPQHSLGPVFSLKQLTTPIDPAEEIVVCYCDLFIKWDFSNFVDFARNELCDGVIASHTNWHPHRIYNNYFAYMRVQEDNVLEIQEKKHFTNNPINEPASSGIYYFKSHYIMQKYLNELLDLKITVNNEYYVTMVYNLMIRDKLKVNHFLSDNYVCLGTPKDVEILIGCLQMMEHLAGYSVDYNRVISYYEKCMS